MTLQKDYVAYKTGNRLSTRTFEGCVQLEHFLRDNFPRLVGEMTSSSNGYLFSNKMTGLALGFAHYDCRPTPFCRTRCYGLALAGPFDFNMYRLSVLASECLKRGDSRYLDVLIPTVRRLNCLKIGHWGDAVLEQVPVLAAVARECSSTACWWYTRKIEIATTVNGLEMPNLRAYLSLDPSTGYPHPSDYPFALTYVFGDGQRHPEHDRILADPRLTAIFLLKRGGSVQDPDDRRLMHHPKLCREKLASMAGHCPREICLSCSGRCNFRQTIQSAEQPPTQCPDSVP